VATSVLIYSISSQYLRVDVLAKEVSVGFDVDYYYSDITIFDASFY